MLTQQETSSTSRQQLNHWLVKNTQPERKLIKAYLIDQQSKGCLAASPADSYAPAPKLQRHAADRRQEASAPDSNRVLTRLVSTDPSFQDDKTRVPNKGLEPVIPGCHPDEGSIPDSTVITHLSIQILRTLRMTGLEYFFWANVI